MMPENYMLAAYYGTYMDGAGPSADLNIQKGSQHVILVEQRLFGGRLRVRVCTGYKMRPLEGMDVLYPSLHAFLHDWQPLELRHQY